MSKLIKCKSCNNEIVSSARFCTECGTKKKKPFYKRGWFIVLSILIIIGVIAGDGSYNTTTTDIEKTAVIETKEDSTKEEKSTQQNVDLLPYESTKNQVISILEDNFGEYGEIKVYEKEGSDSVIFSIPSPDGIVEGIAAINSGMVDNELIASYENMKNSLIYLSKNMFELGEASGKTFYIALQNNQNTDNVLLVILNGVVISETAKY